MAMTLNIPPDLMREALAALGYRSKTDVVIFSLRELIRRKRIEELKALAGKVKLDIDLGSSRRRRGVAS